MKNNWRCRLLAMLLALMLALPGMGLAEDDAIVAEDVDNAVSESGEWLLDEDAEQAAPEAPATDAAEDVAEDAAEEYAGEQPGEEGVEPDAAVTPVEDAAEDAAEPNVAEDAVEPDAAADAPEDAREDAAENVAEQPAETPAEDGTDDAAEQPAEEAIEAVAAERVEALAQSEAALDQLPETDGTQAATGAEPVVAAPAAEAAAKGMAEAAAPQILTSAPIAGNTSVALNLGDTMQLVMAVPVASFKSSKNKVVVVTNTGLIGAVGEGKATITATVSNNQKIKIAVTVNNPCKPTAVAIDLSQGNAFFVGLAPVQLNVLMEPVGARTTLKWKSSNKKVAVVSPAGVLTPLRPGKTKITVTTANKKKYTAKIRVYRNILNNISPKPTRAHVKSIGRAWAIQMKSLERTAWGQYIATFYILDGLGRARWINNFNVSVYLNGKLLAKKNIRKLKVYCQKGDFNTFKVKFTGKEVRRQDPLLLQQCTPESVVYTLSSEPSLYYNHKMLIGFMQDRQNVFTELPAGVQNEQAMANHMFALINQLRAVGGRKPYVMDEELTRAACVRAGELAVKYSGTRPDGSASATVSMKSPTELRGRLKVSTDDLGGTNDVFNGLVRSKSSLSRLLSKSGKKIGICAYKVYNEKNNTTSVYWALEFAQW